jgi:hypothetical protein
MWSPAVLAVASSKAPVNHNVAEVRTAVAYMVAAVVESAVRKVGRSSAWNNSRVAAEEYTAAANMVAAVVVAAVHKVVVGSSQLSTPHIQPDLFWNAALDTKTRHSRPGTQ